jgi:hypothetical protein
MPLDTIAPPHCRAQAMLPKITSYGGRRCFESAKFDSANKGD